MRSHSQPSDYAADRRYQSPTTPGDERHRVGDAFQCVPTAEPNPPPRLNRSAGSRGSTRSRHARLRRVPQVDDDVEETLPRFSCRWEAIGSSMKKRAMQQRRHARPSTAPAIHGAARCSANHNPAPPPRPPPPRLPAWNQPLGATLLVIRRLVGHEALDRHAEERHRDIGDQDDNGERSKARSRSRECSSSPRSRPHSARTRSRTMSCGECCVGDRRPGGTSTCAE